MRFGRRPLLAGLIGWPAAARAREPSVTLSELARRATIYLFPVYEMYRARWRATVDETNPHRQRLNRFRHVPALADARTRDVTTPNADTLYSSAWLDLSLEPLFLTVPPVGDLYYSYAFIDLFDVGMRALAESPLPERDRPLFEMLAPLKLKPGRKFDRRAFDDVEHRALRAGIAQGHADIRAAAGRGRTIDGWTYGERNLGNFGDDYLYRAATALTALGGLTPAEAVYVSCVVDSERRPLSGAQRYTLAFPTDGLPPARAFWSLSAYEVTPDGRAFFVDNPIDRYSIGDLTPGLVRGTDGSLTIYIQRDQPPGERAANWLPAPAGPMRLVLRAYQPDEALVEGTYRVPAVRRNSSP